MKALAMLAIVAMCAGCASSGRNLPVVTDTPPHIIDTVTGNKPAPIVAP